MLNLVEWGCEHGRGEPGVFALEVDQSSQWGTECLRYFSSWFFHLEDLVSVFFGW